MGFELGRSEFSNIPKKFALVPPKGEKGETSELKRAIKRAIKKKELKTNFSELDSGIITISVS
jgi:hypothetical protein